jgi:hypothetical protein
MPESSGSRSEERLSKLPGRCYPPRMAQCPACEEMTFDDGRCSTCGYEEAPVYELPMDALEDAEPLSLDAIEPFAPESHMSADVEPLDISMMEDMEPLQLESSELSEPVELIEGFEGTQIEERARPVKKEAPKPETSGFAYSVCPSCEAPVAQPNPAFCEACGTKLASKKKKAETALQNMKVCGDCGTRNDPERGRCKSCGARLKSAEV